MFQQPYLNKGFPMPANPVSSGLPPANEQMDENRLNDIGEFKTEGPSKPLVPPNSGDPQAQNHGRSVINRSQ
jgi:hypothetical protein